MYLLEDTGDLDKMTQQFEEIQGYLTQLEITLLGVHDRAVRKAVEAAKYIVETHGAQCGQQRLAGQAGVQGNGDGRSMYQFQQTLKHYKEK